MHKTIGMIVLNEARLIRPNLAQHYDWADRIIVIEGADRRYPPGRVTTAGLSSDGTGALIRNFPDPAGKIRYIPYGWAADPSELRNAYARHAGRGLLYVIDADEFYPRAAQSAIDCLIEATDYLAYTFPHVHLLKGTDRVITGGYWDISHTRFYRWQPGWGYRDNHNQPCDDHGVELIRRRHFLRKLTLRLCPDGRWHADGPCSIHFGFAKEWQDTRDKQDYYLARGEATTRPGTTECREAWFTDRYPEGCSIRDFGGPLPEVFAAPALAPGRPPDDPAG